MIIRTLSTLECTRLLAMHRVAHLACAKDGQPYVVPVNYAYADSHLYAFSLVGKKIEWMRINPLVSLHIHEPGDGREWRSVVVLGRYEELPGGSGHEGARDHAWSLLSKHFDWWEPGGLKPDMPPVSDHSPPHVFYRILVEHVSGREAKE
ncbi:pyridoxamine 5'-phosphate oxidase family protein [Mesorhizobium sp.]|uniref:pyridoxamine 5'-phosphate oxidase family protein n=1 Tax=Mesorhizobium sp. TaxID=1871066 RepID=UPI000FE6E8F3|nr:pyridoxamine 5'-phosphate oxidase family protein [Mesorhizobium sp.]RWA68028.1 MAG: pyridoxamine 5'-phosphate oxidase family protein [Mesorhizobium sp.]RWB19914.1 MAG: pyridoxamine 5'-phosphate oxidase family protein [Mesorhizobium sp.]